MSFRGIQRKLVLLAFCLAAVLSSVVAQPQTTAPPAASSIAPGPKPADAPSEWKRLVGIYIYTSHNNPNPKYRAIVFEQDQHLLLQSQTSPAKTEEIREAHGVVWIDGGGDDRLYGFTEDRNEAGSVTGFSYLDEFYERTDAGSEHAPFFHITPTKPTDQLRASALASKPPKERGQFRKPDLVELAPLDPAFHFDIRYAQSSNFLSTPVYTQARAFLQRPAAEALLRVLHKLQPYGYGLLIHDAYRPWYVTKIFWDATPPQGKIFVADPQKGSKHNRGCAVDITLYDLDTGKPAEMPGLYDEMSPRSFPTFPGGTSLQRWNRDLLRRAMESEGFTVNEAEWWHFDYKDWKQYPILNLRFEDLGLANSN